MKLEHREYKAPALYEYKEFYVLTSGGFPSHVKHGRIHYVCGSVVRIGFNKHDSRIGFWITSKHEIFIW